MSDNILDGFHWRDGWYFHRNEDQSVRIAHFLFVDGRPQYPPVVNVCIPAEAWASIVASVSARGETTETYYAALAFHNLTEGGKHE
mgnify:FL=1